MTNPAIGPTLISTICSRDAEKSVTAWCDYLHQTVHSDSVISDRCAQDWGLVDLAGQRIIYLANAINEPWLRIIEAPNADYKSPFQHYGWLSLEINVEDVDALYPHLIDSPFEIIGKPANLDVSDDIRAMQCVGPDGEVLYLTEVKAPVPPFELPTTRCVVDRLFIPVAMVQERAEALAVYERFEQTKGLQFDTKITVINHALGLPTEHKHPVATVQLAGNNLVELDEIPGLADNPSANKQLATGIYMISFEVDVLPDDTTIYTISDGPLKHRRACLIKGSVGELMELVERI